MKNSYTDTDIYKYIHIIFLEKDRSRKVENDCFLFFGYLIYVCIYKYIYIEREREARFDKGLN